jgi:hypothetical protein
LRNTKSDAPAAWTGPTQTAAAGAPAGHAQPAGLAAEGLDDLRRQCFGTIPQCLNLEHEFNHAASKLCILGFEPLKESLIARTPLIKPRGFRIPPWQI